MHDILGQLSLEAVGGLLAALVAVLTLVARLHPYAALAIGLPLLAVPVALWVKLDRHSFASDGSAAGLFIFFAALVLGVGCGTLGARFTWQGLAGLARGEGDDERSKRRGLIVAGVVMALVAGISAWRFGAFEHRALTIAASSDERQIRKRIGAGAGYRLRWNSRDAAPKLVLALDAADLQGGTRQREVAETSDGPLSIEIALPDAPAMEASLRLYRDDSDLTEHLVRRLDWRPPADQVVEPASMWLEKEGAALVLRGLQCGPNTTSAYPAFADAMLAARGVRCFAPEAPLARYVPGLMGFVRAPLVFDRRGNGTHCVVTFRYRQRVARVSGGEDCHGAQTLSTLADAVEVLARAERDAYSPPDAKTRMARAAHAVQMCDAAGARFRSALDARVKLGGAEFQAVAERSAAACAHATRLAISQVEGAPREAAALALRAMEARPGSYDSQNVEALLAALAPAGESRELLWAHALRLSMPGSNPAGARERAASIDLLAARANQLAPDDPLLERIAWVVPSRAGNPASANTRLAMLAEWRRRAQSAAPSGDAALKALYYLCQERTYAGSERELTGECADQLIAAWRERVEAGGTFDAVPDGEAGLLLGIARMYYAHGFETKDFKRDAANVARVRALAEQRLGERYAPLAAAFADLEAQLSRHA